MTAALDTGSGLAGEMAELDLSAGQAGDQSPTHCCQIAEYSSILVKSSGKNMFFAEEIDGGTAIKFLQKQRKSSRKNFPPNFLSK